MELSSGVKFRCYPTEEQQKILSQWMGCQRSIYNAKVGEDRYFRTLRNHSLALTGIQTPVDQQYAQFKSNELTPFLYDVPSQVLHNDATVVTALARTVRVTAPGTSTAILEE